MLLLPPLAFSQNSVDSTKREYTLTIRKETVSRAGKNVTGMTVNGGIPGPTLRFTEGDTAVIYVKNELDVETSVHWHGLLVPNFYDGVPYLTTPPIKPGQTQKYTFPLKQSGTYWYHAHTQLQEQRGVFGSIVIEPKEQTLVYDKELVLVLSDWTNQKPMNVLRNLKRGNEWYNIRKGTSTPLNRVIGRGAFGAQLNFWKQRMESADIADIYYNAFLINGQKTQEYPEFKPGERVRLRFINAAASSQFWLTFGGEDPMLVSADGQDVVPVKHNKTFIAIAETYDFIVTMPPSGKIEIRGSVQDGSGTTAAFLGQGPILPAPNVLRPDKIAMMQQMAKMDMRMGAPAMKFNPDEEEPQQLMDNWGMKMGNKKGMGGMAGMHHKKEMDMSSNPMSADTTNHAAMDHSMMDHTKAGASMDNMPMKMDSGKSEGMSGMKMDMGSMKEGTSMPGMEMPGMNMFAQYNYDYLKSPGKTTLDPNKSVRKILLNLTGNMWRYIWSMNGVPLSEADKISIKQGEVVRITFNNLTMMHHPMHLHGHFFRVINKNGAYSPLKHTVNVPPMQKVTIEFDANEYGGWFLHCHVLYHLVGGMARVVSYDTVRDPRLKGYPLTNLTNEGNGFYTWGMADVASHMTQFNLVSSNIRNQFNVSAVYGWNQRLEAEVTYERYLYDYFRVFVGVNTENERDTSPRDAITTAVAGIRFLTPYLFNLDARIDSRLRPRVSLSRSLMVFPRTMLFGAYEYRADFGWTKRPVLEGVTDTGAYRYESVWSVGMSYFLSRNVSLTASYANRFGAGGGLSIRF
ncbi:multicopper oxidase domain-containing protein [Spirosoma spitsbergense]|uniref:multicopper oxidase domain-containing protein n=1 Tax=Spirosoma spitsbergense TaxID=431554 RepID=UPI0005A94EA0|nr:multicopper oxidase domain-containing protein [Spirosoma spitsbergense]